MKTMEETLATLQMESSKGQVAPVQSSCLQNGKSPDSVSSTRLSVGRFSKEEKIQFAMALMQTFQMLKEYGKQGQDFDVIVQGFLAFFDRRGYSMARIIDSLFEHLSRSREIPTAFDIDQIICPPPIKPERLPASEYVRIMKDVSQGKHLWGFDKEFVDAYRRQQRQAVEGIRELEEADRQAASAKPMLEIGYEGDGWEGEVE